MTDLSEYHERVAEEIREALRDHLAMRVDESEIAADRLLASGGIVAEVYQRGYDDGCDDPESMWTSTKQAYRDQGAAEVRTRVEALCNAAERHADTYKRACIVTTGQVRDALASTRVIPPALPIHRTEAGYPNCATCEGGGCLDCTDPA